MGAFVDGMSAVIPSAELNVAADNPAAASPARALLREIDIDTSLAILLVQFEGKLVNHLAA